MRAIIIEDEISARRTLRMYIKKYFPQIEIVCEIDNTNEAITKLNEIDTDVVFLDVQLKDGSSLNIFDKVDFSKFRIIFTTAFENYALDAFQYRAFGYLVKPLDPFEFEEIMNRVIKDFEHPTIHSRLIKLPVINGYKWIPLDSIVRCESNSNYSYIYCQGEAKPLTSSRTLKYVEENIINSEQFIRIHQSHLVNTRYLENYEIKNNSIKLIDGTKLPVSRLKRKELIKHFQSLT